MTQEEIIASLIEYFDAHLNGVRGSVHQNPYKSDFFLLFKEAYDRDYFDFSSSPRLTGDALRDILAERWLRGHYDVDEDRLKLMETVLTMWDEWRYAWDRIQ